LNIAVVVEFEFGFGFRISGFGFEARGVRSFETEFEFFAPSSTRLVRKEFVVKPLATTELKDRLAPEYRAIF
jgi:hypothetical protein